MKDKVMAELPVEDISKISSTFSKIPTSPQQAMQKLLLPEQDTKQPDAKKEGSSSPSTSAE